ncbi:hypothetical protein GCM10027592_04470 [Spirosoma flavus]
METIELADIKRKRRVSVKSIEYFESEGNYTYVHLKGERPILIAKTLLRFAEQLPEFIRIHKGTLVNPSHIVEHRPQKGGMMEVYLSGERSLTVARRRANEFKQQLSMVG